MSPRPLPADARERQIATRRRRGCRRTPTAIAPAPRACRTTLCTAGRAWAAETAACGLLRRACARGRPGQDGRETEDVRPRHGPVCRGAGGQRTVGDGGRDNEVGGRKSRDLHAQGGRARLRPSVRTWCAHCQIYEEAHGGVIAVCACPWEVGCMARYTGSSSGLRAEGCSKAPGCAHICVEDLLHRRKWCGPSAGGRGRQRRCARR